MLTLLNIPPADTKPAMTALNAGAEQESKAVEAKPNLSALPAVEQDSGGQVLEFTGLDLREKAGGGAYLECSNVSTRNYPCLSPRIGRAYRGEAFQGVDDLFRFDGRTVFRRGTQLWFANGEDEPVCVGAVEDSPKSFAVVNTRMTIWPDAVCLDLVTGKFSALGLDFEVTGASVQDAKVISGTFPVGSIVSAEGLSTYGDMKLCVPVYDSESAARSGEGEYRVYPGNVGEPDITGKWIVPSYDPDTGYALRRGWLSSHRMPEFAEPNGNGVVGKITSVTVEGVGAYSLVDITFELYYGSSAAYTEVKTGDVVFLSGLLNADGTEVESVALRVWGATPTSMTFGLNALYGYTVNSTGTVKVERRVPALDYVCASSNRLWGVSNAVENTVLDDDGNPVKFNGRAVFCSKLGDPANWYYYQGVSMDSWTAAVASEGDFTGICAWSDDILCFKEREMFRITGSQPSSYTLFSFSVPGVEQGSGGSIAIIDEVVYYKNEWGVYRYNGGTPTRVSENVSDALMGAGDAGTDGRNYFLSTPGGIYVYDTWHNAWAKHDTAVGRFAWDGGTVLFLDQAKRVSRIDGGGTDGMPWSVTLHPDYGTTSTGYYSYALNMGYKYYKYVFLRGELLKHNPDAEDPYVVVSAKMGDAPMREIGRQEGAGKFVLRMPVKRLREDCIQLKMDGSGDCVLRDIRYVYGTGSEWVQKDKGVM